MAGVIGRPRIGDVRSGASHCHEGRRLHWSEAACHIRRRHVLRWPDALGSAQLTVAPFDALLLPVDVVAWIIARISRELALRGFP